ncbi:MAG: fimbrillin family protein [Prevotella sp.]|nr:fimbrillin family protein [Prevotella sp.]
MKVSIRTIFRLGWCSLLFAACTDHLIDESSRTSTPITLSGNIRQDNATRASDYGFVTGDRMGVYIVDYENGSPGTLAASGNRASNVLYTFDGEKYEWTAPLEIYWRDNVTPVDVYGYYPGTNAISDPSAYRFEVSWQQNILPQGGEISNYESSDLLWGKAEKVQPTTDQIVINYHHQLAGVSVTLKKGDGMTDVEWDKIDKTVQVDNTVRTCHFDLQTAELSLVGNADRNIQMLPQSSDQYRAVVIPQTVDVGKSLISITIDGKTYNHTLSNPMKYVGGKMHNFTLTVNKSTDTGDYTVTFADEGITDWVNDETSHNFVQNQYVIIDCPEQGKLKESITAAGYDYKMMQNLKVRGKLTTEDFDFMNKEMPSLKHLNLSDVTIKHAFLYQDFYDSNWHVTYSDDALPSGAFRGNENLRTIVLPSSLKIIGSEALNHIQLMNTTVVVPEGVTRIYDGAFSYNDFNNVELVLPQSIDTLGWIGSHWKCEFNLSDNIKEWGGIGGCPNFYGTFHFPSQLKKWPNISGLGSNGSFDGEVEVPQGVSYMEGMGISFKKRIALTLPAGVKHISHIGNSYSSLTFNDDLEVIDGECFYAASLPFQITLPSQLREVRTRGFWNCSLEGELIIPENCLTIGGSAFSLNRLTSIKLPSKIEFISGDAFGGNMYTTIEIPKYVTYIGEGAFGCGYLQTVICLAETPPNVQDGDPFGGVDKDKCVLEVPEKSVELYRNTPVWNTFKNITPHHELAYNVPSVVCMEKGTTREGIVRSEGAWEVAECPSWVTITPSSSEDRKTEVKITVSANNGESREGKVVFKLKNKDYTTYTDIKQVATDLKEEQMITLQTATKGARAIPIFLVGEGYDAEDIASGLYLNDMKEQMEHIFSIEPMKTYRQYFTVSTAIACSPESGVDGLRKFTSENWWVNENDIVLDYAREYGVGIEGNEGNSTILVLRNSIKTGDNTTNIYYNNNHGLAISWMAKSDDVYPFNQQGFILHELVGKAFGKLGPEQINHFTFMKACGCPGCNMSNQYEDNHRHGWWQNVSISGKLTDLPWYHLIFDEKYAQIVDAYEGAMNHSRGAYRSENASVMGNQYIPYFNTISREILVRRIMEASGGEFDFDIFKQNDKIEIPE